MLLLRAFHGLTQQLITLQVALPWGALLRFAVGDSLLLEARELVLPKLADDTLNLKLPIIHARKLCVRVYENNVASISLDLPAEAALELESLIPAAALAEIKASSEIDLRQLTSNLQQQGIMPQLLFETDNGEKRSRVWLE
jgi:hypothetical protein